MSSNNKKRFGGSAKFAIVIGALFALIKFSNILDRFDKVAQGSVLISNTSIPTFLAYSDSSYSVVISNKKDSRGNWTKTTQRHVVAINVDSIVLMGKYGTAAYGQANGDQTKNWYYIAQGGISSKMNPGELRRIYFTRDSWPVYSSDSIWNRMTNSED